MHHHGFLYSQLHYILLGTMLSHPGNLLLPRLELHKVCPLYHLDKNNYGTMIIVAVSTYRNRRRLINLELERNNQYRQFKSTSTYQ